MILNVKGLAETLRLVFVALDSPSGFPRSQPDIIDIIRTSLETFIHWKQIVSYIFIYVLGGCSHLDTLACLSVSAFFFDDNSN